MRVKRYVVGVLLGAVVVVTLVYGGPGLLTRLGIWMFREKRIVYQVPGMDRVHVQKNLTSKDVAGQSLLLDVYIPAEPSPETGHPVVLLIHGGPVPPHTAVKDWGTFVSYGQLLAASGVAAAAFGIGFLVGDRGSSQFQAISKPIPMHGSRRGARPRPRS